MEADMRVGPLSLVAVAVVLVQVLGLATDEPLLGFPGTRTDEQRALEAQFDAELDADNLREWMERLSARPHHVGSPYGKRSRRLSHRAVPSMGL